MKALTYIFCLFILLAGCKETEKKDDTIILSEEEEIDAISEMLDKQLEMESSGFQLKDILGVYSDQKTTIAIDSIMNTTIYGYSIVDKEKNSFEGTLNLEELQATIHPSKTNKNTLVFTILENGKNLKGELKSSTKEFIPFSLSKQSKTLD